MVYENLFWDVKMIKFDKYKKKTLSKYWNNFSIMPKNSFYSQTKLKKTLRKIQHFFGFKITIKLRKIKELENDEFQSFQKEKIIIKYRNEKLSEKILIYLKKFQINSNHSQILKFIQEFQTIFYKSPVRDLGSGFGFNESLILYCILKKLNPAQVIESGVMRGFTTYIIDKATSKNCKIFCYDINFDNLVFKSKKAEYFNHDISHNFTKSSNDQTFAFWDDHTSHLDRLKFSLKHKIKYNVFDDDLSFLNFHSDGWPPIPSISMLKEIKQNLINKNEIQWMFKNKLGKMWLDNFKNDNTINLVKDHYIFPDLFSKTGYKNHSQCSFLILK